MSESTDRAEELVAELKSEKTFDARKAITGATYPQDKIEVYADAELAHELNVKANEAAKARHLADSIYNAAFKTASENKTIESDPEAEANDAPGYAEANAEAEALEAEVAALLQAIQASVLTYHMRGLAPAQWRLIDQKWRKKVKAPARKNYAADEEGEEEFELATLERNMLRNNSINHDLIASAIVKVENVDGDVDSSVWSHDDVQNLFDAYMESEYEKLKNLMQQLTFANNIFQVAVNQDADFLSRR